MTNTANPISQVEITHQGGIKDLLPGLLIMLLLFGSVVPHLQIFRLWQDTLLEKLTQGSHWSPRSVIMWINTWDINAERVEMKEGKVSHQHAKISTYTRVGLTLLLARAKNWKKCWRNSRSLEIWTIDQLASYLNQIRTIVKISMEVWMEVLLKEQRVLFIFLI